MQLVLDASDVFKQLDPDEADKANQRRRALLESIEGRARTAFKGSKPHLGPLSPGCLRCGHGQWSCMFLNSVCNASCFFCTGEMRSPEAPPFAERMEFRVPGDYSTYLARLGFSGASFSGGEPFLTFDKLLAYTEAVRSNLGNDIYIWAYTNGMVTTPERIDRVARAGLDELRFNIVGADYDLSRVRTAVGRVPRVTIEIPAIPEDTQRLKRLLPAIRQCGVDHLNLHQLMVMGPNANALIQRGYTFLKGITPGVVESELCALELLQYALDEGIDLAINYCSLCYKERWQNRIEDFRGGPMVMRGSDSHTEAGCIRRTWIQVTPTQAETAVTFLKDQGLAPERWMVDREQGRLYLHTSLFPCLPAEINVGEPQVFVAYYKTVLGEAAGGETRWEGAEYHEYRLSPTKTIGVRLIQITPPIPLSLDAARSLGTDTPPEQLLPYEQIATGLPDY